MFNLLRNLFGGIANRAAQVPVSQPTPQRPQAPQVNLGQLAQALGFHMPQAPPKPPTPQASTPRDAFFSQKANLDQALRAGRISPDAYSNAINSFEDHALGNKQLAAQDIVPSGKSLVGNAAKGLAYSVVQAPYDFLKSDIINPTKQLTAQATGNKQAYANAEQSQKQILQPKRLAGDIAQIGLMGAGGTVAKGVGQVVKGAIPRAAITSAALGGPFNAAAELSTNPTAGLKDVAKAWAIGTAAGGVLGFAGGLTAETLHDVTPHVIEHAKALASDQGGFLGFKGAINKHPAIQAIDSHLKDLNAAREQLVANNAPKASVKANGKAYKSALGERNKLYKQISQGGYVGKGPSLADEGGKRPANNIQSQIEAAHNAGDNATVAKLIPQLPPEMQAPMKSAMGLSDVNQLPPRSQLSGRALSVSSHDLKMGRALGLSDEQMLNPHQSQMPKPPEIANQKGQSPQTPLGTTHELLDLGAPSREQIHPSALSSSTKEIQGSQQSQASSDHYISQLEQEVKRNAKLSVKHQVGALDYIRTPENVLNKIGLGEEAKALRAADHNYRQELPKEIDRLTNWRKRVGNSPEASTRIFKYLDGQKGATLSGEELKVATEIRTYLKNWAVRLGLPADKRITNYITHIFDEQLIQKEFDPELEKVISTRIPGSVYDPFTQQRLGAEGYKEDAFLALQAYVKRGVRKANMDPALEQLSNAGQALDKHSWDYVKSYGDRINMRPTNFDTLIDKTIKQTVGYKFGQRPVARISQGIRQATYKATLGLNVGSAVRNLTQGINTFSELGTRWTGIGYTKAIKALATKSSELEKVGVLDNSFIEDRTVSAFKQGLQKADKGLFFFFETAEKLNRGAAYFGAKSKALHSGKSLDEAVHAGIEASRKTQFTFGRVDTPIVLQSDLVKLFTQFQSYNVKQVEFLAEMAKNKEYAKLLRFTGATGVVFYGMSKALGYTPEQMLPFGGNVTTDTSPIGGAPAFKIYGGVKKAVKAAIAPNNPNARSPKSEKVQKAVMGAGNNIGSTLVPGFVQGKKTVTGIKAVNRGGMQQGNKKIALSNSPGTYTKAAIFGPYSLKGQPKQKAAGGAASGGPGNSIAKQVQNNPKEPVKGIYTVKGKQGETKYATLNDNKMSSYNTLDEAKAAQAKNMLKYSPNSQTSINGQTYHKTDTGRIIKGASAPKAVANPVGERYASANTKSGKWVQHIQTEAPARGLDTDAILAVAAAEGLSGNVGDGGTSYGPFQLHIGGALPAGKDKAWAESPEGLNYALDRIAEVAKGKTGQEAVAAIVNSFERPADPSGEVARAMTMYGRVDAYSKLKGISTASLTTKSQLKLAKPGSAKSKGGSIKVAKAPKVKFSAPPRIKSIKAPKVRVAKVKAMKPEKLAFRKPRKIRLSA